MKRRNCSSRLTENQNLKRRFAAAHQHPLELRRLAHEFEVFVGRAEAHHMLDARAVVPGAVEEDDFTGGGQLLDVTLEIPLARAPCPRVWQGDDLGAARIEVLREALDRPALARGVAPFKDQHDAFADFSDPGLHLDQFDLER
jgi:hypothetical protein